jgi:hypothetical protein
MDQALFNARIAQEQGDTDGVWFTQLRGHAVRAHVADFGHLTVMELDGHFVVSQSMEITTPDGVSSIIAPTITQAERTADDTLVLTVAQDQAVA